MVQVCHAVRHTEEEDPKQCAVHASIKERRVTGSDCCEVSFLPQIQTSLFAARLPDAEYRDEREDNALAMARCSGVSVPESANKNNHFFS